MEYAEVKKKKSMLFLSNPQSAIHPHHLTSLRHHIYFIALKKRVSKEGDAQRLALTKRN